MSLTSHLSVWRLVKTQRQAKVRLGDPYRNLIKKRNKDKEEKRKEQTLIIINCNRKRRENRH